MCSVVSLSAFGGISFINTLVVSPIGERVQAEQITTTRIDWYSKVELNEESWNKAHEERSNPERRASMVVSLSVHTHTYTLSQDGWRDRGG